MKYFLFLIIGFATTVNAMSGQALVADLNAKYQSNVTQCSNGTPAYYCSGVLLRAVDYSTFFKFWDYGSQATKLGSVAFTYIRSDVGSTALNGNRKSGFILKDQTSSIAVGKVLNLRCIFLSRPNHSTSGQITVVGSHRKWHKRILILPIVQSYGALPLRLRHG